MEKEFVTYEQALSLKELGIKRNFLDKDYINWHNFHYE